MPRTLQTSDELSPMSAVAGVYTSYLWRNVAFTVWSGPGTLESLETFRAACKTFFAEHPGRLSSVHLVTPGNSHLPDAAVRATLARISREYADNTAAAAVVIPGTGFRASAVRGLVTAVRLLGPRDYELKIFGNVEEVAAWLPDAQFKRTDVAVDRAQLLAALRRVQSTADSAAA